MVWNAFIAAISLDAAQSYATVVAALIYSLGHVGEHRLHFALHALHVPLLVLGFVARANPAMRPLHPVVRALAMCTALFDAAGVLVQLDEIGHVESRVGAQVICALLSLGLLTSSLHVFARAHALVNHEPTPPQWQRAR